MKTTQTKSFFWTQLLTTALLGALLGILLIVLSVSFLLKVIFVVMGIMTILSAIPMLAFGLSNLSDRAGRMSFAFSLLSILMGIVMIFWHSDILLIIVGVYFLIFPIVEILAARDRAARAKSELPKMILGVVLLLLEPARTLDILFDVAGYVVLGLTALSVLISLITYFTSKKKQATATGNRIFVDRDGDGTIDAVFVDRTYDADANAASNDREKQ